MSIEKLVNNKTIDCIIYDKINYVCTHLDEDVKSAQNECEQLVKTGRFSSLFPSQYSTVDFSNALYPPGPHLHHHTCMPHDHCPPFPRVAQPVINEPCVVEETPQSGNGELS